MGTAKKKIPKAYYSAIKMSEILLFAAMCMVLENGIFSEVRKILYNITFTWKLKKKNSIQSRNRLIHREQTMLTEGEKQGQKNKLGTWN